MTDPRYLLFASILSILTFALIGAAACVGLLNTWAWYSALPPEAIASIPKPVYWAVAKLFIQILAGAIGLIALLRPPTTFRLYIASIALLVLVAAHILSWAGVASMALNAQPDSLVAHGIRLLFAAWLIALFIVLVPNNSFKPKPLRGSA